MATGLRILPAATVCAIMACTLSTPSCGDKDARYVPSVDSLTPTMTTLDVDTYVSDSGYVKYHAVTPVWQMFDDTRDPCWRFPDGIVLDTYNAGMQPNAHIECDSAVYWTARRLFRLDGDVIAVNVDRDTFLTEQLFWDQARTEFYTDSFIHIVRSDRVIEGYGFTSNEKMSEYVVHRPTAIIPASTLRTNHADTTASPADTTARQRNGRPVPASEREAARRTHRSNLNDIRETAQPAATPRNNGSITRMQNRR